MEKELPAHHKRSIAIDRQSPPVPRWRVSIEMEGMLMTGVRKVISIKKEVVPDMITTENTPEGMKDSKQTWRRPQKKMECFRQSSRTLLRRF